MSAQDQTHTCDSVVEVLGPGQHSKAGELCQEVLQGLKIIPALVLTWGRGQGGERTSAAGLRTSVGWRKGHRLRAIPRSVGKSLISDSQILEV